MKTLVLASAHRHIELGILWLIFYPRAGVVDGWGEFLKKLQFTKKAYGKSFMSRLDLPSALALLRLSVLLSNSALETELRFLVFGSYGTL